MCEVICVCVCVFLVFAVRRTWKMSSRHQAGRQLWLYPKSIKIQKSTASSWCFLLRWLCGGIPRFSHTKIPIYGWLYIPLIYPYKYIYISLYTHCINHHFIMFFPLKSPCYCCNSDFSLLLLLDFSGKFCPGKTGLCNKRSSTKPKSFASHGKKLWARPDWSTKRVVFYMGFLYPLEIKGGYCWEISCMVNYYKWEITS